MTKRKVAKRKPANTTKRDDSRLVRLGKMYAAISATNEAILRSKTPQELYQRVCDAAVHGSKFYATVVFVAEPNATWVRTAAATGPGGKVMRSVGVSVDPAIPEGRGLVGTAFRTKKPCITNDYLNDERVRPWRELAIKEGFAAGAALPLVRRDRSVGVLTFYSSMVGEFDEEMLKLLEGVAENVSFALEKFEQEHERQLAEDRIQFMATHDALTSLPNRVMFNHMLNHAIHSARRYNRGFAVMFIDLDRFKFINDTLGHEAGDELLCQIGLRLKQALRDSDVVARFGGDEFVVLLSEVDDREHIAIVARKILTACIQPLIIRGQECHVSASIGICMYPTGGQDEHTLMKNADMAMYLAKEEGKNNYQFYSEELKSKSIERLMLEDDLRRALERKQLLLHYQARRDLNTGLITGIEALLRWQHPTLGLLPAAKFLSIADETGLIVPIGKWILEQACLQCVSWMQAGLPPIGISVNLSARQFGDDGIVDDIQSALRQSGLEPSLLEIELTEVTVMENAERSTRILKTLGQLGVSITIDDFGVGYSTLAQIKQFPVRTLKIDRSFFKRVPAGSVDRSVAGAVIALAKTLSNKVVAEGVETEEQEAFVRAHACDEMQGHYFSKPATAEEMAELIRHYVFVPHE